MKTNFFDKFFDTLLVTLLCVVTLSLVPSHAWAAGWMDGIARVSGLSRDVARMLVYVFAVVGIGAMGYAFYKLKEKGDENRGDQIKAMHIIWPAIGGAFCLALSFVANQTVETLGGDAGQIGSLGALSSVATQTTASGGWSNAVRNIAELSKATGGMLIYVFVAVGIGALGFAGYKFWEKGNENRGDQVKVMHILWPMIGGACCLALAWVATTTVETLGGGAGDIGRQIVQ